MDFDRIHDNLYIGSCPRSADDVESLRDHGISAVVNLQTDHDFRVLGIDWQQLEAAYSANAIEARRVPIIDYDEDDLRANFFKAAEAVFDLMILEDHKVLVHCTMGRSRSPSVAICYLHMFDGWNFANAETHLTSCRRCSPATDVIRSATEEWLFNAFSCQISYFEMMLTEFKNQLFEPELRVSRSVVRQLQSREFDADQIVHEINAIEQHYDGHTWWNFVNCVAIALSLYQGTWERCVWRCDPPWDFATVILPVLPELDTKRSDRGALLDHLNDVIAPLLAALAATHTRFEQAHSCAVAILEQLHDQGTALPSRDDSDWSETWIRLGGTWLSESFLECAREYALRSNLE